MYSDDRVIFFSVVANSTLPFVTSMVGEVESFLYLLESDTMTAMVTACLRMVRILDVTRNGMLIGLHINVDERGLGGTDAVLESILNE